MDMNYLIERSLLPTLLQFLEPMGENTALKMTDP